MFKIRNLVALCVSVFLLVVAVESFAQAPPPPDYFPLPVGAKWIYNSSNLSSGVPKDSTDDANSIAGLKQLGPTTDTVQTAEVVATEKQEDGSTWYKQKFYTDPSFPYFIWYSKPSGWVKMHREMSERNGQVVLDDYYVRASDQVRVRDFLKNPPTVDATWAWKGKRPSANVPPTKTETVIDESNQVISVEEVTVPAGTFKTVKVVTPGVQTTKTIISIPGMDDRVIESKTNVTRTAWYVNHLGYVKNKVVSEVDDPNIQTKNISISELKQYCFPKKGCVPK